MMHIRISYAVLVATLLTICATAAASDTAADSKSLDLFEQRIMPILKSPKPSSCVQCHLAAVDLKDYILPSPEDTFASLRDQGLIDVGHPEKSKILTLIQMGEKDLDNGAKMIHAKTRQAEHEAFAAWIKACCNDAAFRNLPKSDDAKQAAPEKPLEVIRHSRKSRVVDSFVRNVWSQRMRCYPCHTPHEIDRTNEKHAKAIERAEKLVDEYGDRMHIFLKTPEATIENLVARSRNSPDNELPLINLDDPAKSLLVLKPTSKLPKRISKGVFEPPSYKEPVSHMGGLKMHRDDYSYKAFLAWLTDYANVVRSEYRTADSLPPDNWVPTKHVLFVREFPEEVPPLTPVQFFVHAWDGDKQQWTEKPVAFTQGLVNPRHIVNGVLFLLRGENRVDAASSSIRGDKLQPGRYLIKAFADVDGRLADDPTQLLYDQDYVGQMEIDAIWNEGFPQREQVSAKQLRK